jgi:hypothetical protein
MQESILDPFPNVKVVVSYPPFLFPFFVFFFCLFFFLCLWYWGLNSEPTLFFFFDVLNLLLLGISEQKTLDNRDQSYLTLLLIKISLSVSGPTPWATPPALFCDGFFQDRVSWTICTSWLQTSLFLISASWVARITGVSHQCSALSSFSKGIYYQYLMPCTLYFQYFNGQIK